MKRERIESLIMHAIGAHPGITTDLLAGAVNVEHGSFSQRMACEYLRKLARDGLVRSKPNGRPSNPVRWFLREGKAATQCEMPGSPPLVPVVDHPILAWGLR